MKFFQIDKGYSCTIAISRYHVKGLMRCFVKDKFIFDVFDKYNYILHYLRYKVSKIPGIVLPKGYWSNPKMSLIKV